MVAVTMDVVKVVAMPWKKHRRTKNGNGHLFNEILPPVERTFPFSSSQATNLALPSTLKRTCTQCHEKKWIRVKRVSYVSDFMDFAYTFYFLLALSLSHSLHISTSHSVHRFAFH